MNQHTAGPVKWSVFERDGLYGFNITADKAVLAETYPRPWLVAVSAENARLLAASYNAFDSAARRLGIDAVEFAERMQDGGLADLVEVLTDCYVAMREASEHLPAECEADLLCAKAMERVYIQAQGARGTVPLMPPTTRTLLRETLSHDGTGDHVVRVYVAHSDGCAPCKAEADRIAEKVRAGLGVTRNGNG